MSAYTQKPIPSKGDTWELFNISLIEWMQQELHRLLQEQIAWNGAIFRNWMSYDTAVTIDDFYANWGFGLDEWDNRNNVLFALGPLTPGVTLENGNTQFCVKVYVREMHEYVKLGQILKISPGETKGKFVPTNRVCMEMLIEVHADGPAALVTTGPVYPVPDDTDVGADFRKQMEEWYRPRADADRIISQVGDLMMQLTGEQSEEETMRINDEIQRILKTETDNVSKAADNFLFEPPTSLPMTDENMRSLLYGRGRFDSFVRMSKALQGS